MLAPEECPGGRSAGRERVRPLAQRRIYAVGHDERCRTSATTARSANVAGKRTAMSSAESLECLRTGRRDGACVPSPLPTIARLGWAFSALAQLSQLRHFVSKKTRAQSRRTASAIRSVQSGAKSWRFLAAQRLVQLQVPLPPRLPAQVRAQPPARLPLAVVQPLGRVPPVLR